MTTPRDTLAELRDRLLRLHRESGEPSTREIARRTHRAISHTTVHVVLRGEKTPRWGQLELVVEALGGDITEFRRLWVAHRDAADQLTRTPSPAKTEAGDPGYQPLGSPLRGHTSTVGVLTFDPDGDLLASAGADRSVRLWDPETGRQVGRALSPKNELGGDIHALTFHPEGFLLASGDSDGIARLWNPDNGQLVTAIAMTNHINDLAFRPDGNALAAATSDGVHLWDPHTGDLIASPESIPGSARAVQFHPDGHLLASGDSDGTVRLWDSGNCRLIGSPLSSGSPGPVVAVAFHPEGHLLAAVQHFKVWLWDLRTGQQVREPVSLAGGGWSVAWHPHGHLLATASEAPEVQLWDPMTGKQVGPKLISSPRACLAVAFHPDGHLMATAGYDDAVNLWRDAQHDGRTTPPAARLRLKQLRSENAALKQRLHAERERSVGLYLTTVADWDAQEKQLPENDARSTAIAFEAREGGALLATAGADHAIRLWNSVHRSIVGEPIRGHSGRINAIKFHPRGHDMLATVSDDATLRLWRYRSDPGPVGICAEHSGPVNAVAFDPRDDDRLVTVGDDGTLLFWYKSLPVDKTPTGHRGSVNAVAYHPRAIVVATGGDDHTVRMWNLPMHDPHDEPLRGHSSPIIDLAFEPSVGDLLATLDSDHTLHVWNWRSRRSMNKPSIGQLGAITAMAFHSAGHLLTVVNTEGVVSVWDPVSGEVRGEKRIGRPCAITAIATRTDGFLLAGKETGGAVTLLTPPYGFLVGEPHRSE